MRPKTIALEGLPFVGKSSSASALKRSDDRLLVIPDYHELVGPSELRLLHGVPTSSGEQTSRVATYRAIEVSRWQSAASTEVETVVFDRSFMSIIAYDRAIRTTFGSMLWNETDNIESALPNSVTSAIPTPDLTIYIAIDLPTAVGRHRKLAVAIDERMRTPAFLDNLISSFETCVEDNLNLTFTVDGTGSIDQVASKVREYVYEG